MKKKKKENDALYNRKSKNPAEGVSRRAGRRVSPWRQTEVVTRGNTSELGVTLGESCRQNSPSSQ